MTFTLIRLFSERNVIHDNIINNDSNNHRGNKMINCRLKVYYYNTCVESHYLTAVIS